MSTKKGIYLYLSIALLQKELTSEKKAKLDNLLKKASIHSICSALKEFLLCLDEHLIPASSWAWFSESLQEDEVRDIQSHLYAGIAELPQPNRDTLAYIMLHLQRYCIVLLAVLPRHDRNSLYKILILLL